MINLKIRFMFFALYVVLTIGALFTSHSANALAVTVKRVVFEGAKRAEVITIINNSDEEETYRLGWKHFIMSENKGLVAVPEDELPPEIKPSKDMVKFSPRRFTLPPKGSQQVRMMLRMPSGVEDGEYRSHLWIRPEEKAAAFRDYVKEKKGKKSGVFMKMLAGTSMPVIVRKGALGVKATISDFTTLRKGRDIHATFTLSREGTKSAYGDLDFICNEDGDEYLIKFIRGVSVYAETAMRRFTVKIPPRSWMPYCSDLTIRYTETDGFAGESIGVLAEGKAPVE